MISPRVTIATLIFAGGLFASEFHGTVRSGALPLPGATITAVQGDKRIVSTTDERGAFTFANLPDGTWTLEAEMLGFGKATQEIHAGASAAAADLNLKLLSKEGLLTALAPKPSAAPVPNPPAVAAGPVEQPQQQRPSGPNAGGPPKANATAQAGSRNGTSGTSGARAGQRGYQRLDVNQSSDTASLSNEGAIRSDEVADLNQSAANSFIVQGSTSSALGLPPQNDWGRFPAGMDPMGMGGPGGPPGMNGMNGTGNGEPNPQAANGPGLSAGGPRGGFGGPGGGFGGPGGGFGGPGGGGPGGGGFGGPGGGGPGERGFGRGGPRGANGRPNWQGRPNAMAFGNGRRNRQLQYMGNAFFSVDNSVWDARTFSVTGADVTKPSYDHLRGGVMFGGPLRIPKLVSVQKRIMFTINFQFQHNSNGSLSNPVNMPTALERIGDFSQTLSQGKPVTIYDPATGAPFANATIPLSRISATSLGLLNYFPSPNLPFAAQNYQTALNGSSNNYNLNTRVSNIRLTKKDRINAGVGYQQGSTTSPNLFQFIDTSANRGINANLAWSRNITSHLINNLQYTWSRNRQNATPFFAGATNVAAALGIAGTSQNPNDWGPPNLSFTNFGGLSDGTYSLTRNQTGSLGESLMWIRGTHNMTFGGDFRRQQFNALVNNNGRGTYTFNGLATSAIVDGVAQSGTGYDLADFLLGTPTTSSIRFGNPDKYFRGSGFDAYGNDDWRISGRFSINFGLRWEYATPMTELYNRLVNLSIAPGYTAVTNVLAGQNGLPGALISPDRNNFSPRVGFAWRPLANDSTIVRGGYGVYYNTSVYNLIANNMAQQPPFAQVLSVSSTPGSLLDLNNAFLQASGGLTTPTYAVDPNYRIGYAQTWTISIQHDLPLSMFGTVGYLGTKGTRLDQQFIPNSVAPGADVSPYPHNFIYETSNGDSTYHALQTQLNRRFRSGLGVQSSYQFSKSIDNAGTGGRGQANTPVAQNWLDLSAERGLSSFDARHNLSFQMQYSTGMGRGGGTLVNGPKGALFKDWTLSGNITLRSGNPFTATVGGNRSQVSGTAVSNTVRAEATGLPIDAAGLLFNTAAFTAPAAGQWGDAGRNTIPGPTVFSLNSSLGRVFRLGERRSIDLQLQAQNLLNHVTITSWGTVLGSTNYGLAAAAAPMRTVSMSVRFRF